MFSDRPNPVIWYLLVAVAMTFVPGSSCHATQSVPSLTIEANGLEKGRGVDNRTLEAVRSKDWNTVVTLTTQATQENSHDSNAFYWQGIGYLQLHNSLLAARSLRAAEKLGLDDALLHEALGLAYYDLNQFFLFEQQMQRAASLDPLDFRPHYYLGLYNLNIKSDTKKALELFGEATQLQPDDWKSLYEEGNCFEMLGDGTQAGKRYRRAIDIVEGNSQHFGWPFQGMARLLLGSSPSDALHYAKQAVELEPEEYSNHFILARTYEALGNLPLAISEARIAADKNPSDGATRYKLFTLYRVAGDRAAANAELAKFLKIKETYGSE